MGRSLVIVESPAKAKTINKYLGKNYIVKSSVGHVRDLPTSGGLAKKRVGAPTLATGNDLPLPYTLPQPRPPTLNPNPNASPKALTEPLRTPSPSHRRRWPSMQTRCVLASTRIRS